MNNRTKFVPLLFLFFLVFPLRAALSADHIGTVLLVKGEVRATNPDKGERLLKRRSEIYRDDQIVAGSNSSAQLKMSDGARLMVKPDSVIHISEYRFKEGGKDNSVVMELVSGGFRSITGIVGKGKQDNYRVDTPMGSIGVRGTDYEVQSEVKVYVGVWSGEIIFESPECTGLLGAAQKNQYLTVDPTTCEFSVEPPPVFRDGAFGDRSAADTSCTPQALFAGDTGYGALLAGRQQRDYFTDLDEVIGAETYRYVDALLDAGYPVQSIILHSLGRGLTVTDVAFYLILADPSLAGSIYASMARMLPYMPSWVCAGAFGALSPIAEYSASELGRDPSIQSVAERYFNGGRRLRFGYRAVKGADGKTELVQTRGHIKASIDELLDYATNEQKTGDAWWYRVAEGGPAPGSDSTPVFVGLYPGNQEVIVDASVERLEALKGQGFSRIPVTFVFNRSGYIPTYAVNRRVDVEKFESATVKAVIDRYLEDNERVSRVRGMDATDYHLLASRDELSELFEIPAIEDVPAGKREAVLRELKSGEAFKPVYITFYGAGNRYWIDSPERVAVASTNGMNSFPVAFLYHDAGRMGCNLPPTCLPAMTSSMNTACGGTGRAGAPTAPPTVPPPPPVIPPQPPPVSPIS